MRTPTSLLVVGLLAACRPSATVEHTTPVANLQTHRTASIQVRTTAFAAQGRAMYLENAVTARLREKCGFERIDRAAEGQTADLRLDLNITNIGRGGGVFSNENQATIDVLLVVSDGQTGDLLGASKVRGKSSGMIVNNNDPENQAIDEMAKTIAEVFVKSGCAGPRIARAEPPPPAVTPPPSTDPGAPPPPDETKKTEAEALNEQGKEKLRSGDMNGALATFQQATQAFPDPRFVYNICLTYQALENWDNAIAECKRAKSMSPDERLAAKIDHRLELLASRGK